MLNTVLLTRAKKLEATSMSNNGNLGKQFIVIFYKMDYNVSTKSIMHKTMYCQGRMLILRERASM